MDPNLIEKVLINFGYLLMLLAFAVRDILWLRSILIGGQLSIMAYALSINNNIVAFWNILFVIINSIQVVRVIRERRPIDLPQDLYDLYDQIFSELTRREFLFFWEMGLMFQTKNKIIIKEGEHQNDLSLILSGTVNVVKNGKTIANLQRGSFIAEMSFLTNETASADVKAEGTVTHISWGQDKIRSLKILNPQLLIKIQNILGKDLAQKVKAASTIS